MLPTSEVLLAGQHHLLVAVSRGRGVGQRLAENITSLQHRSLPGAKAGTEVCVCGTQVPSKRGKARPCSPSFFFFSSSSPHKLAAEAVAKAGAGRGDVSARRAVPPFPPSSGKDRPGSAFDATGSMHNLSSVLLTPSNHLCSG